MPFRIGSLKTLNYESRLDNMTDEDICVLLRYD